jgi:cobalt-zinc-cadmium efflux system outer membrane protein
MAIAMLTVFLPLWGGVAMAQADPPPVVRHVNDAMAIALQHNPGLAAARERMGVADGHLQQASVGLQHNPELSVRTAHRDTPERTSTDVVVELSQELEIFGQPQARREAAETARSAVMLEIEALEWEVHRRVRAAFYALQVAEKRLALAQRQMEFAESLRSLSARQLEAGEIAATDHRQTGIQAARLSVALTQAEAAHAAAAHALHATVGVEITLALSAPLPNPISPAAEEAALRHTVLETHPAILAAHARAAQQDRLVTVVRKEARPNITGSLFFEREEAHTDIIGAGVSIPIPVFNRRKGDVAAAEAEARVAQGEAHAVAAELARRFETAWTGCAAAQRAAAEYYESVLPMVETILVQLENAFRLGEISLIELRVSQRDLLDAQQAALDALADYYGWRAELEGLTNADLAAITEDE